MKWLKRLGIVVGFLYLVAMASLYFIQDDVLFLPDRLPDSYRFSQGMEVEIEVDQDVALNCLHVKGPSPKGVVLYLHGNRGSNRRCLRQAENLMNEGFDLFMPDYRGYGKSDGVMESQRQVFADIQKVYDHLVQSYDESDIHVVGYSLGSAMASFLAAENEPQSVTLVAPFYSIVDMKNKRIPIVPNFLLKYPFCNNKNLAKTKCPIYIFHGTEDELIPYDSAERLAQIRPNETQLVALEGTGHRGAIFNRRLGREFTRILHR